MKHSVIAWAVGMAAATAVAAPLDYLESWDTYTAGNSNKYLEPYTTNWPDMPGMGNRYPIDSAQKRSLNNSLQVDNGTSFGSQSIGISHDFGQEYQATDENPIIVEFWFRPDSTTNRKYIDLYVDLAKDDISPTTSGTLHQAVTFGMPRSVRGDSATAYMYNGTTWLSSGLAPTSGWNKFVMTIKSNVIDLAIGSSTNVNFARTYTGAFDQINIRHLASGSAGYAHVDDIYVHGGVEVPEPASLVLLGLGGLVLRRRQVSSGRG